MPYADTSSEQIRQKLRAANRRHYWKHRERVLAKAKERGRNKAKVNAASARRRSTLTPVGQVLFNNAKQRARAHGIEFTITREDLVVPTHCPVFGMELVVGTGCAKDNSPSVDRVDPTKGYVPGNVRVISHKANTIKNNATAADLRAVLIYMESLSEDHPAAAATWNQGK
jgi:hypothetical protein